MPKETKEQLEEDIESGKKEEDVYTEEGRGVAEDSDEITNVDEGFLKGYEGDDLMTKCATCGKILEDEVIEEEFDNTTFRFCSENCAEKFEKKRKKNLAKPARQKNKLY